MTASAISGLAPTSPRAASRAASRAEAADASASPFASLIGAPPESDKPAAAARDQDASEAESTDDAEGSEVTERPAELPAWLLALRATPPAVPDGAAATALPGDGEAAITKAVGGLSLAGLPADRALKTRGLETPPTWTPPVAGSEARATLSMAPTDMPPVPAETLPMTTAVALDARQSAALDAAIGTLAATGPEGLVVAAAPPAERTTVPATAVDGLAPPPTPPDLATLTDAFGEPLALDGRDAALRLGERLRWLTESGVQEARMQLHPRELGSVDIRIRIEGQGASVWFGAEHPAARAALEATLPQLRQQLAAEGLALGQAEVGGQGSSSGERGTGQSSGQGPGQERADGRGRPASTGSDRLPDLDRGGRAVASAGSVRGLVDRYA